MNQARVWWLAVGLGVAAAAAGCNRGTLQGDPGDYVNPTIAVMKFENRAAWPLGWDLGDGMRDILVDRLVRTHRYHVIERQELGYVQQELGLQSSGLTREEGRATVGRLKNAQYLIKGTITDFGHVSTNRGAVGTSSFSLFGGSNKAIMSMVLYVVDVESGEILCSECIEKSISAKDVSVQAAYKDVSFGGTTFYRTPLGRATAAVIDTAVKRITETIASRPWVPKVVSAQADGSVIVVNGGSDRGVLVGSEFEIFEPGPPILDPDTGDLIGHAASTCVGRLKIREVRNRLSLGFMTSGRSQDLRPGQMLRRTEAPVATQPSRPASDL